MTQTELCDSPTQPEPVLAGWPAVASALPQAEQAAEAVAALLRLARGMAECGRRVDLAGLERLIGPLCARSMDLPAAEGRRMVPLLAALVGEIDALHRMVVRDMPD